MGKKRLVRDVDFTVEDGQCLIISHTLLGDGLSRVVINVKDGKAKVRANGRTRFEFEDRRQGQDGKRKDHSCEFWLGNTKADVLLEDVLRGKFWGQFTFGKLVDLKENKRFVRALNRAIKKLVAEFEEKAATHLNSLVKKYE